MVNLFSILRTCSHICTIEIAHSVYVLTDNSGHETADTKQDDNTKHEADVKQEGNTSSRKQEDVTKPDKDKSAEPEDARGDTPESGVSTIVITSPPSKLKQ